MKSALLALSLLAGACATPRPDRYVALSPQATTAGEARGYSNTSSSIALPSTRSEWPRVIAGYNDHHGVFDDTGRRIPGTSAAAAVFSDTFGDDWTRATFTPPPVPATRIGDPSLAYGVLEGDLHLVFYAMTAIVGTGNEPNRVLIACSADRGRTFSQWSIVPDRTGTDLVPAHQTAHAPSLAFESRTGKLLLVFVADQGTSNGAIQQWDGAPPPRATPAQRQANPCRFTWTRQTPIIPSSAVDRPYVRHPMLQAPPHPASARYLLYEIHRPLSTPSATADTELQLQAMFMRSGSGTWLPAVPVDACCQALSRSYTFKRDTIAVAGQPAARGMAMADFAPVEYPNAAGAADHAVIVWAGAAQPNEAPAIHYEEIFFHDEHLFRANRPDTPVFHFAPEPGAAFSPTVSAWGIAQAPQDGNPARGGLRAIAWYQQARDGSLRLMGSRSFDSGATFDTPRNLTVLQPGAAAGSTPLCATLGQDFGTRISSVFVSDLRSLAAHHLLFHASSRPVACTDNTMIDHSVRYQEMAATRWTVRAPRR